MKKTALDRRIDDLVAYMREELSNARRVDRGDVVKLAERTREANDLLCAAQNRLRSETESVRRLVSDRPTYDFVNDQIEAVEGDMDRMERRIRNIRILNWLLFGALAATYFVR